MMVLLVNTFLDKENFTWNAATMIHCEYIHCVQMKTIFSLYFTRLYTWINTSHKILIHQEEYSVAYESVMFSV